ncbi:MAG: hypothetical protein KatS3mg057_2839 [Herpetosiphonaceae bacterium]|nr:MAG: hypothetical protein KatS3mg057_2839 [Herpetosiphonaceae bacterium]
MEKNTIHVVRDSAALANAAAELVTRIAQEAAATRGRFTIALAGGSTPRAAYEQLAQPPLS